jgi:hypothetical protein
VANKRRISADEAKQVGATLGLDWKEVDLEQFRRAGDGHRSPRPGTAASRPARIGDLIRSKTPYPGNATYAK